jgi:biotin carboxyl carrier protein
VPESALPYVYTAVVGAETRTISVVRRGAGWEARIDDGVPVAVDGVRTGPVSWSLVIDGKATEAHVLARGSDVTVDIEGQAYRLQLLDERALRARAGAVGAGDREIRAVMPGKVVAVLVEEGATVEQGDGILVIEAMKMENEIQASRSGTVTKMAVAPGQAVESGELLAVIDD